ncbi:MAG: 16S rRNA (guanine(966)-N(2))-methyltransferase RsmD [Halioglobus sp.]
MAKSTRQRPDSKGQLRIIGGQWRGRKLQFTATDGLRPTTDRVRETLFNWLMSELPTARCLDLFAGSGALGLEALSRGAAHCDFVDNNAIAQREISTHLTTLAATDRGTCHTSSAADFLSRLDETHEPYTVVFLDPPFGRELIAPVAAILEARALLASGAYIYVECAVQEHLPELPKSWNLHREKTAGGVAYRLFVRS